MTKQLFVHLGTQKTGSKALQTALRAASTAGFVYPQVDGGGFGTLWHRWIHERLVALDPAPLEEALAQIGTASQGVLSYERLHSLADPALDLLAARCREMAGETVAVIFLRRQDEFAGSRANQFWKAHRVPFAEAEAYERAVLKEQAALDYDHLLARLEGRFARVIPLIYEKGRSSVGQFAAATGISLSEPPPGTPDPNPAAGAVDIATLKAVKRLAGVHPRLPEIVEATRQALARPGPRRWLADRRDGPASMLDPATAEAIMQRYAESNARLQARWFPERKRLFPPARLAVAGVQPDPRTDVVRQIRRKFDL